MNTEIISDATCNLFESFWTEANEMWAALDPEATLTSIRSQEENDYIPSLNSGSWIDGTEMHELAAFIVRSQKKRILRVIIFIRKMFHLRHEKKRTLGYSLIPDAEGSLNLR